MQTSVDLRAVTDRVLGLSPPRVATPARLPRQWDRPVGLILLLSSALTSMTSLALWAEGLGGWAARLFGASVLLLALTLRLL